jgi:hypothetical protein
MDSPRVKKTPFSAQAGKTNPKQGKTGPSTQQTGLEISINESRKSDRLFHLNDPDGKSQV